MNDLVVGIRAGPTVPMPDRVIRRRGTMANHLPMNKIERETISIDEAAVRLGISRHSAYQAAANGELPTLRLGRRLLVRRAAFERLLAEGADAARADGRR